jgi:leucyl-tRNA synthetase
MKKKETPRQKFDRKCNFAVKRSKELQNKLPKSEVWFQGLLKTNNLNSYFLSNIPLNEIIPDFINLDKRIVIEIDGEVHNTKRQIMRDTHKDAKYAKLGYKVYRVEFNNINQALQVINELKLIFKQE